MFRNVLRVTQEEKASFGFLLNFLKFDLLSYG